MGGPWCPGAGDIGFATILDVHGKSARAEVAGVNVVFVEGFAGGSICGSEDNVIVNEVAIKLTATFLQGYVRVTR